MRFFKKSSNFEVNLGYVRATDMFQMNKSLKYCLLSCSLALSLIFSSCRHESDSVERLSDEILAYGTKVCRGKTMDEVLAVSTESSEKFKEFINDETTLTDDNRQVLSDALIQTVSAVYECLEDVTDNRSDDARSELRSAIEYKSSCVVKKCKTVGQLAQILTEENVANLPDVALKKGKK